MPIDNNPSPEYKKAMVVVAHPDDAEYGCSGTVAQWCSEGMEVVYLKPHLFSDHNPTLK